MKDNVRFKKTPDAVKTRKFNRSWPKSHIDVFLNNYNLCIQNWLKLVVMSMFSRGNTILSKGLAKTCFKLKKAWKNNHGLLLCFALLYILFVGQRLMHLLLINNFDQCLKTGASK